MTVDILREKFLDFFKSKKHKIAESDSLVPKDDPTVLFTPAGMNQFKEQFLGHLSGFSRAATSQRCLRTDDLEKVGKTSCHHTFFEMLGNFSFGDYFKKEAIAWAWEFLTKELKIEEKKLWVSVYKDDDEAYQIWKDVIKIPQGKIVKLGDKENFWPSEAKQKGPNGPCGPCSEIFFDFGNDIGCKKADCSPACSCGRFTEIWNLVFTQFNRKSDGSLEPLPKKNIDTGMGLERLAAVMQGVKNNFETDLFSPIIKEINRHVSRSSNEKIMYAIADHIRAIVFAIYDGVLPSNEGRGYVIRKIIRKAIMYSSSLGIKGEFLHKLVPIVTKIMQQPYPELEKRRENIAQVILAEEKGFDLILGSSKQLFTGMNFVKDDPVTNAHKAFQLHDTHGIPYELTKQWLASQGIAISEEVFQQDLSAQKERSKTQSAMQGDVFAKGLDLGLKETKFFGYQKNTLKAEILKAIKDKDGVQLILDKTVFYPESGGQVGDTGLISKGKSVFTVQNTRKLGKAIAHSGVIKSGSFKKGDMVNLEIDTLRRTNIMRNHTATHLLQAALRSVLGAHIQQQGSLVTEDRLRFDFTHFKEINQEELERIEEVVNEYISANYPVSVKQLSLKEAKKTGALAFFAEKYTEKVRVVSVGEISKELCGGTHLNASGLAGVFKIIREGSIASGIRRIEAKTGFAAYKAIKDDEDIFRKKYSAELESQSQRLKELEKQLSAQKLNSAKSSLDSLIQNAEVVKGIKVITDISEDASMDLLRKTADMLKEKAGSALIALGSKKDNKALLIIALTADLAQKGLDAGELIRKAAQPLGGSGGGRKDFAQAGGDSPQNFAEAFKSLKDSI